jgi:hypothetical protein
LAPVSLNGWKPRPDPDRWAAALCRRHPILGPRAVLAGELDETIGETDAGGMRQHLVSHWRVWLLIVVAVVVVNEVVDRNFFDHREHIDGDFAFAVLALVSGFLGSYLVARRKRRGIA